MSKRQELIDWLDYGGLEGEAELVAKIDAVIAEEREACAHVCEDMMKDRGFGGHMALEAAAKFIRARGGK